jgi:catechol 2,3-dioxygenase-like lactoylglutathione lyase family enzyme
LAVKIGSIVIHCFEFEKMIDFWQKALNYRPREAAADDWAVLTDPAGKGPNLSFQKREKKREKRNWIHLDLYTNDQKNEVERLKKIGAKEYPWRYPANADYVVLEDPDGNLFCVVITEPDRIAETEFFL